MLNKSENLTPEQMEKLRRKHKRVSPKIFLMLSKNEKELSFRKELVQLYEHSCKFFSDGSVINKSADCYTRNPPKTPPPPYQ